MSKLPSSTKCEACFGKAKNRFAAAANLPQINRKPGRIPTANQAANLPSTGRPQGRLNSTG